ncbi:tRNA preQ1(34) S-adenosylmethionine ribosyltransferase-isomerase QueA [Xylocopilactobacillus apis]|uniref:S-adenosylmethionine:tRNA ribosyltransferase-isomerase n=1 Tax=Xylocopilactobacillus apis TaxID=2932183 RepID=A0AAU9CZB5_9LACO|nr:tRNA preQ1(34) S-adenosylmethionine ribosyltransferase-isomerase QueA [Xylocopilactobacillus apis]BDR56754.1 S-adenosylmethionine:tRNA ribosyltransferase-isomerase [Xylocopilactobacillus apis]
MTSEINLLSTESYDYDLPKELIAQTPISDRSSSRLLVLDRKTGKMEDEHFYNIINYLNPGDTLVLNDSKVMPARLIGEKEDTHGHIEFLLLKNTKDNDWEVLAKPARHLHPGTEVSFGNGILRARVNDYLGEGRFLVTFSYQGVFLEILDQLGEMPLPPYIKEKLSDKDRYQTVYAKNWGSAAAPTAGLHWTKELLQKVSEKGINVAYLTLHVGLGTFRPVNSDNVKEHHMHSEYYILDEKTASLINETQKNGKRIIANGTTVVRTLETIAHNNDGKIVSTNGYTDIFIYPGFKWEAVDALITNFHLPKSTLVMLVSSFASRDQILAAYEHAIEKKYRFFSFGDAMFIE